MHSSASFLTHVRFDLSYFCPGPFPPLSPFARRVRSPLSYIPGYDTCKSWSEDANCADPSKSVKIQKCTISYDVRMQLQQSRKEQEQRRLRLRPSRPPGPPAESLECGVQRPLRSCLTIFYPPCVLCSCFR